MQREIKFKIYFPERKIMNGPYNWNMIMRFSPKDFIPLQYTGLKDKNGVEIYEGDIVKFKDWKPKEVFYECGENEKGFAGFRLKNTDMFLMGWDADFMEVVGNIFENPELLNQ